MYVCRMYLHTEICTVVYILLHCTYSKLGCTIPYHPILLQPMYLLHHPHTKTILPLQPLAPQKDWQKMAVINLSTTRMTLTKHATHEFSRLLPLPYPCFYSAFAFPTSSAFSLSLDLSRSPNSPPPSYNSTYHTISPKKPPLRSLITLLHSLR